MQAVQDDPRIESGEDLRRVARYLRFLGCPSAVVEDLAQETALAAVRAFPGGAAPLPWLLATARNQLRKLLRDQGRRRELADVERLDELWQREVPDGGDEVRERLRECLRRLPERSREVLRLRYGDDASVAEIAARVGLGVEGVRSMLARLKRALAECVGRRGGA